MHESSLQNKTQVLVSALGLRARRFGQPGICCFAYLALKTQTHDAKM